MCSIILKNLAETENLNLNSARAVPIPPDDGDTKPLILRFVKDRTSRELCNHFAYDDDHRCQLVEYNWYWIRKPEFPVYQFRFGRLTFFAYRWRMYRTGDCDLVEFMVRVRLLRVRSALYSHPQQLNKARTENLLNFQLQIKWRVTGRIYNETKTFQDQNKLVLFYIRPENTEGENADIGYTDFGQGRGWFSFVYEDEYFSFNMYNMPNSNFTLLLQNHGSKGENRTWDSLKKIVPPPEGPQIDPYKNETETEKDDWMDYVKNTYGRSRKQRHKRNYDPERER